MKFDDVNSLYLLGLLGYYIFAIFSPIGFAVLLMKLIEKKLKKKIELGHFIIMSLSFYFLTFLLYPYIIEQLHLFRR